MTGKYIETTLTITPYIEEAADIMAALLAEVEYETFIPTETGSKCYILKEKYQPQMVEDAIAQNPFDCTIEYSSAEVEDEDWNKTWVEECFTPIYIGEDCVIHSPKDDVGSNLRYNVLINPVMAFGSGHHQTTAMMTQWLLTEPVEDKNVLDMGCGTAILAIVAKMRGAEDVVAIDIDERAYNNAIENTALNNCSGIQVRLGGAEAIGEDKFDIILANINKNILINDMSLYAEATKDGGNLFVSGFFETDIADIEVCANKFGFVKHSFVINEEWASVKFEKKTI